MKYRKKPIEVDAFRYGHDAFPYWFTQDGFYLGATRIYQGIELHQILNNLQGIEITNGDWFIRPEKNRPLQVYCNDIFIATYEAVE